MSLCFQACLQIQVSWKGRSTSAFETGRGVSDEESVAKLQ